MNQGYLLDTNLLIAALEPNPDNAAHEVAKQRLDELMQTPDAVFGITPLIRYEIVRGARVKTPDELNAILDGFTEFEIGREDAVLAAQLSRLAQEKGLTSAKRSFDFMHCAAALVNGLSLCSQDGDIPKIMALHPRTG